MKRWLIALAALLVMIAVCAGAETLAPGSTGETVRDVQEKLAALGYYTGGITGHYGAKTGEAVLAFRGDFGLGEGNEADDSVLSAIAEAKYRPIQIGSAGEDVKRLQTRLAWLGYYGGKISGNYLSATADAVREFQVKTGQSATGSADVRTLELIFDPDAPGKVDKASATPAPAVPEEVAEVPDGEGDLDTTIPFKKKMAYGDRGGQIKELQQKLTDMGYYTGPISGNYLGNTRNAVKAFQKQNALETTGKVNEETWNAIMNNPYAVMPDATPKPTARPESPSFHLVVDVTNQVVHVYARDEEGEYTVPVREMICSSGTTANPSDIGDWVLSGYKVTWCYFPKWGDYARYWTRINNGIAFHSVIYNTVSTMDLSVKSYNRLGRRASHGCVRLQVSDAKWIYDYVEAGTVVTITQKLDSDEELKDSVAKPALNYKTMLPVQTPRPTQEPIYVSGARPPLPLTKLEKNDAGEAVFWLQKKLTELGYYTGKISGKYLSGTAAAVKAFQQANGLRADGKASVQTLEMLYAAELAPLAAPTPLPTAEPEPEPIPTPEEPAVTPEMTVDPTEEPLPESTPAPTPRLVVR